MMFKMEELSFLRTFVDIDPHCPMSAHIKNIKDLYIQLDNLSRRTSDPDRVVLVKALDIFQSVYSDFVKIQDEVWRNYKEHFNSRELRR